MGYHPELILSVCQFNVELLTNSWQPAIMTFEVLNLPNVSRISSPLAIFNISLTNRYHLVIVSMIFWVYTNII